MRARPRRIVSALGVAARLSCGPAESGSGTAWQSAAPELHIAVVQVETVALTAVQSCVLAEDPPSLSFQVGARLAGFDCGSILVWRLQAVESWRTDPPCQQLPKHNPDFLKKTATASSASASRASEVSRAERYLVLCGSCGAICSNLGFSRSSFLTERL